MADQEEEEMALPFEHCVRVTLAEARELIMDGAADDLTTDDLVKADRVLTGSRAPADVEALAEVVALGYEYLTNVDREAVVRHHLAPDPVSSVRYWYLTAGG
jgi:hypothetical protein